MAIAEDASTPPVVTLTGDTTGIAATASFTPPANSLLVAILNVGYSGVHIPGMTISDSAGGTWTLGAVADISNGHSWIWYQYCVTSPGAITVTTTDTETVSAGRQLAVRVLTGAHRRQGRGSGATSQAITQGSGTGFHLNNAEQYTGAWAYIASVQNTTETLTPTAATTTISDLADATDTEHLAIGRKTTPASAPGGNVDLGWNGTTSVTSTFVALEIIPDTANPVPSFNVTATNGGAGSAGMAVELYAVSGQSASPIGVTATAAALSASITPGQTGSLVFGSVLGGSGTFTGLSGTTILYQNNPAAGLQSGAVVTTSPSTGGSPETVGVSSTGSAISTALLEVLTGAGSLAMFVGSAGIVGGGTVTVSNPISPPTGSLLVAMIQSNGGAGVVTVSVTDNSGLGLTWTEQVKVNTSGSGYTGIWTAVMPGTTPTTLFGQTSGSGGVASDTNVYTLGMEFTLAQDTPLTGIWFNSPGAADAAPAGCAIFARTGAHAGSVVTGTLNTNGAWSGAGGSGWVRCGYDGSVTLTAGTVYQVVIDKQAFVNVYGATAHYWDGAGPGTSGLTSGVVHAPSNAASSDVGQDSFHAGSFPTYPDSTFNAANYWVDVEVTPAGSPPPPAVSSLLMASFP
jgi:hypothetical protein